MFEMIENLRRIHRARGLFEIIVEANGDEKPRSAQLESVVSHPCAMMPRMDGAPSVIDPLRVVGGRLLLTGRDRFGVGLAQFENFGYEEQVSQERAQVDRRIQIVDQLRADCGLRED